MQTSSESELLPQQKRARHCNKCTGRPLMAQWAHTKAGREYLARQGLPESTPVALTSSESMPNHPEGALENYNPCNISLQRLLETVPITPTRNGRQPSQPATTLPSESDFSFGTFDLQENSVVDSTLPTPSPSSLLTFEPQNNTPSSSQFLTDELSNPSPTTVSRFLRKKARVSRSNPSCGHVVGAMRGSKKLDIIRPQPLRKRVDDQSVATKRFHREMAALIVRSERLAEETGCWLVLLGQHSNSGASVTHFTSASLRRDAKEDTLGLVNKFQATTRALLVAKRQGALDMAKKLVEAQETAKNAKKTLASKEAQLAAALTLMAQHGLSAPLAASD